jgi:hypothetical protein
MEFSAIDFYSLDKDKLLNTQEKKNLFFAL